ncbi:DNA-binding transcriptional MerR regulator [Lactobacillus colini]|uniref:DNA-binding transcriptional MerR regulator n=1 Tax=Lactobacillus colini TaxID=1819254 RepID=A0ABS4MD05_9LACO|nr:MerR family transcriptional regulator [Lactobacillus colini]MBP2057536.1 DNA-binding transcriptional MerR regulator [Lactobacillus colini]
MKYSIGQVAEIMGINTSALRFYDKKGLIPFVKRDENGRRYFEDNDLNFIEVIDCMKKSGLEINDIKKFISLCMSGDQTLKERYDFLDHEEEVLIQRIKELQAQLAFLRYKKWYYKTSLEAGTEGIHFMPGTNEVDPNTKKQYEQELQKCSNIHELIDYRKDKIIEK